MIRVAILVEGQTEEEFVKRILASHLCHDGVSVTGHNLGGGVGVHRIAREMRTFCRSYDVVTSLVDYYGFKGKKEATVEELEQRICTEVEDRMPCGGRCKIYPYVQRHEFEGLLFSNVEAFQNMPSVTPTVVCCIARSFVTGFSVYSWSTEARFLTLPRHRRRAGRGHPSAPQQWSRRTRWSWRRWVELPRPLSTNGRGGRGRSRERQGT